MKARAMRENRLLSPADHDEAQATSLRAAASTPKKNSEEGHYLEVFNEKAKNISAGPK